MNRKGGKAISINCAVLVSNGRQAPRSVLVSTMTGQAEDADASLLLCVPVARQLKERIRSERGLTATIGIASNKLLAKIASDFEKPDGLTVVSERDKVQFLRPLPARVLYGVGRVTEQVLLGVGIGTVGDLQDYGGNPSHQKAFYDQVRPVSDR